VSLLPSHEPSSATRHGSPIELVITARPRAGHAYGERAPVGVRSPTLYVHAELDECAAMALTDEHEERAAYVVEGAKSDWRARDESVFPKVPGDDVEFIPLPE